MFTWIMENIWTIIICAVLIIMVAAVIANMIRNKKKGKSSCGCGCASCPAGGCCAMNDASHPEKSETTS